MHPDDPDLNAHVHAAIARHRRRGWRLDRAERSVTIDGAVALATALDRASQPVAEPKLLGWL